MMRAMRRSLAITVFILLASLNACTQARPTPTSNEYFAIEVIDAQTRRGVPLVELETVNGLRYVTDSAGLVAFREPGLMNQKVFFTVRSHGYQFPKDFLGFAGKALDVTPGGRATLEINRINIAERLYRVTGGGIYADCVLLGRKASIEEPLLNGKVVGQDSVQSAVYRGKIYWFWGDTNRPEYPLGHFGTAGATSDLPGKGGLDPSVGVNLKYFVDETGFSRKMVPMPEDEKGPVWIDGLTTLHDESGRERLVAHYARMKDLGTMLARGLLVFNDEKAIFEKLAPVPLDAPLAPAGHALRAKVNGVEYLYFTAPYPNVRVRADWKSFTDLSAYEGFTPLVPGTRVEKGQAPKLERDANGKLVFGWKRNTPPLTSDQQQALIESGAMRADESPQRLIDIETDQPVLLHGGSVNWNAYRKKWLMIGLQGRGTSFLGEVWYAESDGPAPEGPWRLARKIVTHDRYSFYNPAQHPFFDSDGGRYVYFEGTFANTFSGTDVPTPRYDYNQVMYRLDLADPRLRSKTPSTAPATRPN